MRGTGTIGHCSTRSLSAGLCQVAGNLREFILGPSRGRRLHRLGTDPISQEILAGGLLYPCQAIFFGFPYSFGPVMTIKGRGVVVSRSIEPAELAMLVGLTEVVQRIGASVPLRYLTDAEVGALSNQAANRYRELASASHALT